MQSGLLTLSAASESPRNNIVPGAFSWAANMLASRTVLMALCVTCALSGFSTQRLRSA